MITYLFGVPGSGKSYKAIQIALDYIKKDRLVFSNIELTTFIDSYIYLDFNLMQKFIDSIFNILREEGKEIEYYVEGLKKVVEKDALYIIDEAHFYGFADRKKAELWRLFLSIHRHLHIDILIITQTYKNINSSLLDLGEIFIKAMPPSKRLISSRLEYLHYATSEAVRTGDKLNLLKREVLKADKKIFDLYKSGAVNKGSSLLRFKVWFLIAFLFLVVFFIYYNIHNFSLKDNIHDDSISNNINVTNTVNSISVDTNNTVYVNPRKLCFVPSRSLNIYNVVPLFKKMQLLYVEYNNTKVKTILIYCKDKTKYIKEYKRILYKTLKIKRGLKK